VIASALSSKKTGLESQESYKHVKGLPWLFEAKFKLINHGDDHNSDVTFQGHNKDTHTHTHTHKTRK
jgi:hypothetical protein